MGGSGLLRGPVQSTSKDYSLWHMSMSACARLLFLLLLECFVEAGNGTSTVPLNRRLTTSTAFRKETCEPGKARGLLRSDVAR